MVPNIISTKDISYLSDMFQWNFNISKNCNNVSQYIQLEEVKSIFLESKNIHKEICQAILDILGGNYE